MAILRNTIVNGNIRNNGILVTDSLSINGIDVSILSGTIASNTSSNSLVSASQVAAYIQSQTVTPTRSENTVSWSSGWVTAGSSTGSTTSRSAGSTTITSDYLTTTNTGYSVEAYGTVSTGAGWITSGSTNSTAAIKYINVEEKTASAAGDITPSNGKLLSSVTIPAGQAHDGYVTTSGWINTPTEYYTLSYDSQEECVDFIFNA